MARQTDRRLLRRWLLSVLISILILLLLLSAFYLWYMAKFQPFGITTRITPASEPVFPQRPAYSISGDGRFIVYQDRVRRDGGETDGVLIHDRRLGQTELIPVVVFSGREYSGSFDPAISENGRFVVFASASLELFPTVYTDVFLYDRQGGTTTYISVGSDGSMGNGWSSSPSVSEDGRLIAFQSEASNLVPGDTNGQQDIFVRDLNTGKTSRVSVSATKEQISGDSLTPSISADGRYVLFYSESSLTPDSQPGTINLYIADLRTDKNSLISHVSDQELVNTDFYEPPVITRDGRFVLYKTGANNSYGMALYDRRSGVETLLESIIPRNTGEYHWIPRATISADGRMIVFESSNDNLVDGDTNGWNDVFLFDRRTGKLTRVSIGSNGAEGDQFSANGVISADGRHIVFSSRARNFEKQWDTDGADDLFVHDLGDWHLYLFDLIRKIDHYRDQPSRLPEGPYPEPTFPYLTSPYP